jgi:3-deoxy-D-manno-octulosonate 8-phosphate phosphatase (KDO 8-P phosphatase)
MIKLLVLDVDGCLSDGKLIYSADGIESKNFNVKDGLGISTWNAIGNYTAIITGKSSKILQQRANDLGVEYLYQGIRDKQKVLEELVASLGLDFNEVAVIGDDLNDYKMLKLVQESFTPKNGVKEIKSIVKTVLSYDGGDGAVREMIDILVAKNSQKDKFMAVWI